MSNILKNIPFDARLKNYEIENMQYPDSPLVLNIHIAMTWPRNEPMIYLNPLFHSYFKNNPFTKNDRKYPVEMPYKYDITYDCKLQIPNGYHIEDTLLPASVRLDNNALYKNSINYDKASKTIRAYSHMLIGKTEFSVEEYSGFKYFFDKMLADQQQTLIIKKL